MDIFFFQAEDGIRDLVRSRGLGDVYKRQAQYDEQGNLKNWWTKADEEKFKAKTGAVVAQYNACLLYTSDAADERSSVDLGGRRIIKKKTQIQ